MTSPRTFAITGATVFALLLVAVLPAGAASFRPNATVDGDSVTLGDLFEDAGPAAGQIVAQSPAPGRRMILDAHALFSLAQAYGLNWRPASPHDRAVVERSAIVIGGDRIQSLVEDALAEKGAARPFAALFDRRANQLALPTGTGALTVQSMTYDYEQGRFSGMLEAASPSGPIDIPVSGRTAKLVEVPVLNRRLNEGEVIGAGDLDLVRMQADRIARDTLPSLEDVIGHTADRALESQRPLRAHDLRRDLVIRRGQTVTLMLEDDAISLTTQGRALTDGAKGETVRVLNISSSRVVEGRTVAADLVAVSVNPLQLPTETASADQPQTPKETPR